MKEIAKKNIFIIRLMIFLINLIAITFINYLSYFDLDYKIFILAFATLCINVICFTSLDHYKIFSPPDNFYDKGEKPYFEFYTSCYITATGVIWLLYIFISEVFPFGLDLIAKILFEIGGFLKLIANLFKLIP